MVHTSARFRAIQCNIGMRDGHVVTKSVGFLATNDLNKLNNYFFCNRCKINLVKDKLLNVILLFRCDDIYKWSLFDI